MSTCTTAVPRPIVSALPNVHDTAMTLPHSPPPPSRVADWSSVPSVTPPLRGPVVPKPRGRLSAPHALHFEIPQLPTPIPPSLLHRQSRSAPSLGALLPPVTLPAASVVPLRPSIISPSEAALISGPGVALPSAYRLRRSLTAKVSRGTPPSPPNNCTHAAAHEPGKHLPTSKPALSTKRRRSSFTPSERNGDSHPPRLLHDRPTRTEPQTISCNGPEPDTANPSSGYDSDPHPSPDIDMEAPNSPPASDSDRPRPASPSPPPHP